MIDLRNTAANTSISATFVGDARRCASRGRVESAIRVRIDGAADCDASLSLDRVSIM
jgi:hypothetical protein